MSKPWFRPKRYGYGAGLPICWQGWALLVGFIACIEGSIPLSFWLLPSSQALMLAIPVILAITVAFVLIVRAKTDGGWHWRNGSKS